MSVKPGSRVWYLKSANGFTPYLDKTYFFEKNNNISSKPIQIPRIAAGCCNKAGCIGCIYTGGYHCNIITEVFAEEMVFRIHMSICEG